MKKIKKSKKYKRGFKEIQSKEEIKHLMHRLNCVFYLFTVKDRSIEQIAKIMKIPEIMVTFWMGTEYFQELIEQDKLKRAS